MKFTGVLRDYQVDVIKKALPHREALLVMSTGSGKTLCGLELVSRLALTATILVPNTLLQEQWVNTCRDMFGYDPGIINGSTKSIKGITVSTYGSLANNEELLRELAKQTSILIVDEAHTAVTDKRIAIIKQFSPSYIYGLTATPMREDGKTEVLSFIFGKKAAEFHMDQMCPTVQIHIPGVDIEIDEYPRMIDSMVENDNRNVLVSGCALGEVLDGRKVLVLTKRRIHAQYIKERFPQAILIDSDDKDRNKKLQDFKSGKAHFNCIIGTTALLATGMDIPSLDTLILACDMRSQILTTQSAGRILRLFEGKAEPKIIDFWDGWKHNGERWVVSNKILYDQFRDRYAVYHTKGWKIHNVEDWMHKKLLGIRN